MLKMLLKEQVLQIQVICIGHWSDFFDQVKRFHFNDQPKFERPQFTQYEPLGNKMGVQIVFGTNICNILNKLLKPNYRFSTSLETIGKLDFNAQYGTNKMI